MRRILLCSVGLALALLAPACDAQKPPATAFYLTTKELHGPRKLPRPESIRSPAIDGVFIRIGWDTIEPEQGRYDWTLFDQVVKQTVAAHKVLSLAILAGEDVPEWLEKAGVPITSMPIARKQCRNINVVTPWDPDYIAQYLRMMAEVKRHLIDLGAYDLVRIVKLTAIAQQNIELRLPHNNRCASDLDARWASLGYRPSRVVDAWGQIAKNVATLYPKSLIVQEILQAEVFPAIGEDGQPVDRRSVHVAADIIARCIAMLKARCGVQWDALKPRGPMAERVIEAHRKGATIGWQTNLYQGPRIGAGCQTSRRAGKLPCTEADYTMMLRRGIDLGGSFIEIWEPDLNRFPAAFAQARRAN